MHINRINFLLALLVLFLPIHSVHSESEATRQQVIRVGVYDNPPKVFINSKGEPDGIFIDIIKYISAKENIKIEYQAGEWAALLSKLQTGEIDVLPDMAYSDIRKSLYIFSTLPVLGSWLEIFTTKESGIRSILDLTNKRIGVLRASIQEEFLIDLLAKESELSFDLISFDDYTVSVKALKRQEIDAIIADRFFYFSELFDAELLAVGIILRPTELFFAFPKEINPELVERFDRHLSALQNDPKSEYYQSIKKWFDKDVGRFVPEHIRWIIIISVSALLIALAFSLLVQHRVNVRTKMLRQMNQELTIAKDKAMESDRLKSAFLANISHEIRTPMSGIIGFTELLKNPDISLDRQSKYIDVIEKSINRLLHLTNNLIDISKIEAGVVEVVAEPTDINKQLDLLYNLFKDQADSKGIRLELFARFPENESVVITDKEKLLAILSNLIKNAIKYSGNGSISFGCIKKEASLEFFVTDSGIGIPKERQQAIFERFVQADIEDKQALQGAGLGLAISKAFVEKLGGRIWVESEAGKGAAFYFTIPYITP